MVVRVTVVSDTHLSARTPEAVANWRAVVDDVAAGPPDLVVHAGDVTADGADRPEDLPVAVAELERLGVPLFALPGNHDVGDNPCGPAPGDGAATLVDPERLARYRRALGPDRWTVDRGPWRLVGLDAQLLGSGLAQEEDQWGWLAGALGPTRRGGRHLALFLHKPVHPPRGQSREASPWRYVLPAAAERLAAALGGTPLRVVVSGHVHQHLRHEAADVSHVWAPTTWAVLGDHLQAVVGEKACGVLDLALADDGAVHSTFRRPAGVAQHVLGDDLTY